MITCANCAQEALFSYDISANRKLYYCHIHLPKFLKGRGMATLLRSTVTQEVEEPVEEKPAPKKRTKKKAEPVVEETPVEEESTEEAVEETDGAD